MILDYKSATVYIDPEYSSQETTLMYRTLICKTILFLTLPVIAVTLNFDIIEAQNCPDDILSNGKYFFKESRFQDAIATFKSVTLMFPESNAAEESLYMIVASYRELADRQKTPQWLSRARENIRIYKRRYPEGRFAENVDAESKGVEQIEAQLTGASKGMFITLTSVAVVSVVVLGLFAGR